MVATFANAAAARAVTIMGPRGGVSNGKTVIDFMEENGLKPGPEYQCFID